MAISYEYGEKRDGGGFIGFLLICTVIALALLRSTGPSPSPGPEPGPRPSPGPDLAGTTILYVYERTEPVPYIKDVIDSLSQDEAKSLGYAGWRIYDVHQVDDLTAWAASLGVAPPFIAFVNDTDEKKPVQLSPFPKTPAELRQLVKRQ